MIRRKTTFSLIGIGTVIAALVVFDSLIGGDWSPLFGGKENFVEFWQEDLWPPDWSLLEARKYPACEASIGFFCSKA